MPYYEPIIICNFRKQRLQCRVRSKSYLFGRQTHRKKLAEKKTLVKALPRIDVIGNTNVLKDYEFTVFWS